MPCYHVEVGDSYISNVDVAKAAFHLNKPACNKDKDSSTFARYIYLKSVKLFWIKKLAAF